MSTTPDNKSFTLPTRRPRLIERLLAGLLRCLPVRHGKHLVLSHLDRIVRLGGTGWMEVPYGKASLVVDSGDLVGRHFALVHDYDAHVCDALVAAADADEPGVLWDIGANQGVCCYQMLRRLRGLKVVAIEPQAELYALLRHNLDRLAPDQYEAYCVGLGSQAETLTLTIEDGNRGHASLCQTHMRDGSTSEQVRVETPSYVLEQSALGPPSVIKIDVEGFEDVVFEALGGYLSQWPTRAVVFESHLEGSKKFAAITDSLASAGYDVYRITKTLWQTRLCPLSDSTQPATDFVALRRGVAFGHVLKRMMHT
jgi:FkbM family methyltransferase